MPNLNPAPDAPDTLRAQAEIIRRDAVVRVVPYGCITMGQRGAGELVDFAALAPDVVGFSDDGRGVQSDELMEEAMRRAAKAGRPVVAHCEVDDLLRGGYIHDGEYCRAHGHKGICSESEWKQVERDIALAEKTGCQYHVCHVSTKESVELVRRAKTRGVRVSCKKRWMSRVPNHKYDVVAVDCGIKYNIIRQLNRVGCNVTVVPFDSTLEEIMAFRPDGVVLSNGPGNPQDVTPVIELVRQLRGKLPIFGICMGHQLISLAYGAKTVKMKFGHRGGNHPVKNLATGKIEITSQNHSYAVDVDSLAGTGLELTHVNLLDGTAEGVECVGDAVFSMQYHPESASGPQDSGYLFRKFTKIMEERKNA